MARDTKAVPFGEGANLLTPFYWARDYGGTKERGVRIQHGKRDLFVPDHEILALATALADHIQYSKSKETQR